MTDNSPPSQARTATEILQQGHETAMLHFLLNQQVATADCWPLPDGSSVSRDADTGCYRFVAPDGATELEYPTAWHQAPYANTGYLVWHILKLAADEAGAAQDPADDPPLGAAEAMTVCPMLHELIDEAMDRYELDDHIMHWLESDATALADRIRSRIPAEHWNAIVTATAERLRPAPQTRHRTGDQPMSYSRWSTLLDADTGQQPPLEYYDRWLSEAPKSADYADWDTWLTAYDAWKEPFLEANGLELTSWYIYHHVASGTTPDEQVLAVWSNNVEPKPMFQAPQLREISEQDTWQQIPGYQAATPNDRRHLQECVRQFLSDVYGKEPNGDAK